MRTNLVHTSFDFFLAAFAVDDGCFFFGNANLASAAQISQFYAVQLAAEFFGNNRTAGDDGNILQHRFTAIAKARSLNSYRFEGAAQLVDHQSGQCFAFYVFSNDQQFFTLLYYFFQNRQHVGNSADFAIGDQDVRIGQNGFHFVRIGDHVRRNVTAVELHAFYNLQIRAHAFGFFNSDNTVFAYFFHSFSNQLADFFVSCGNRSNLSDSILRFHFLGSFANFFYQSSNGFLNALFQNHRISAGGDIAHAFVNHSLSQNGSRRGAVACNVIGFGGNFFHQLSAHVFKRIFQFDIPSDSHAVISNERCAEFLIQNHIAAFRSKSYFYSISQRINTAF